MPWLLAFAILSHVFFLQHRQPPRLIRRHLFLPHAPGPTAPVPTARVVGHRGHPYALIVTLLDLVLVEIVLESIEISKLQSGMHLLTYPWIVQLDGVIFV